MRAQPPKWILLLVCAAVVCGVASAAENVKLKYSDSVAKKSIPYTTELTVRIEGVNRLDFVYETLLEAQLPKPALSTQLPGPFNVGKKNSGRLPPGVTQTDTSIDDCKKSADKLLLERLGRFGASELAAWLAQFEKDLECKRANDTLREDIIEAVRQSMGAEPGVLQIVDKDLTEAVGRTRAGGALVITITARPKLSEISVALNGADPAAVSVAQRELVTGELDTLLGKELKAKVDEHMAVRKFEIDFQASAGVDFSLGPFLAYSNASEYGRLPNPAFDSTDPASKPNVVGVTKSGDWQYGIAAYWNANWGRIGKKAEWGVCWGIAYTLQNELQKAISGLVGLTAEAPKKNFRFHLGVAVALEDKLAAGFTEGMPVDPTAEIPVTEHIGLHPFVGISFSIGG